MKSYVMERLKRAVSPLAALEILYNKNAWDCLTQGCYSCITLIRVSKEESSAKDAANVSVLSQSLARAVSFGSRIFHASETLLSQRIPMPIPPHSCYRPPLSFSHFFLLIKDPFLFPSHSVPKLLTLQPITILCLKHVYTLIKCRLPHLTPHRRAGDWSSGMLSGCQLWLISAHVPEN